MNSDGSLINRVANSGLKVINLEHFYPKNEWALFDLKDFLYMELILKEKDFRNNLKEHNWSQYENKTLLVFCSNDSIIPMWAYMLIASYAGEVTDDIFEGTESEYLKLHYKKVLSQMDLNEYQDQRVVIKGCGDKNVPAFAYSEISRLLKPYTQSLMYGEPCSTVPIFKRPRNIKKG